MSDIIAKTAADAAKLLLAIRAKYIIILPDGETLNHGNLELKKPEEPPEVGKPAGRNRRSTLPFGAVTGHIRPFIDPLQVGDVAVVPCPEGLDVGVLQTTCASYCGELWGKGNYKTLRNREKNLVEVLRVG